jgi:arylsulfatase A-like enzyme
MKQPNIVVIVMDTARGSDVYHHLGSEECFETLTRLGREGTRYTNVSANAPWTLPSHATLFSGLYPSQHGAHAGNKQFSASPTLPQQLRKAGYTTVGISNNTWISGEFGFERGFDEFVSTWQLFQDAVDFGDIAQTETGRLSQLKAVLRKFSGNPIKNVANLVYGQAFRKRTDSGAKRTNRIVRDRLDEWQSDDPLFLFVNYLEPHLEYRPPADVAESWLPETVSYDEAMSVNQDAWAYITGEQPMADREFEILEALYQAELEYLDGRIGELQDTFERHGLLEDTVFLVTGDHGENIGDHELMDHQYSLHESLLHVPLLIGGPGFRDGGTVSKPVQLADLYPTILDIANVSESESGPGQSICNPATIADNRPIYAEYVAPQPAIDTLRERYDCRNDVSKYDRRLWSVKREGVKLVRGSDGSHWLYNLDSDPGERENQFEGDHDITELLDDWIRSLPDTEQANVEIQDATKVRLEDLGYLQ